MNNQKIISLPDGYSRQFTINLQKDKKIAILINGLSALIVIIMAIIGNKIVPIKTLFNFSVNASSHEVTSLLIKTILLLPFTFLYIVLHELTHGVFMKRFSGIKPKYGMTLLYAYAGSTAYFKKKQYIIITLAPIVILGMIILVLNILVPRSWFWIIYFTQIANISGAAGDMYVTKKFAKMPSDILIQDSGIEMSIYYKDKLN